MHAARIFLCALFLFGLALPSAQARPVKKKVSGSAFSAAMFKALARQIPDTLISMGYTQMGSVNLSDFIAAMDAVEVNPATWVYTSKSTDGVHDMQRNSAKWERTADGARISVTQSLWQQTPAKARPALALHEYMGATGLFQDDDYTASIGMFFLTFPETREILRVDEMHTLENIVGQLTASGNGSITGVGGGGDEYGVVGKINFGYTILKEVQNDTDEQQRNDDANAFLAALFDKDEIWRGGHI